MLQAEVPVLAVVKKYGSILESLIERLRNVGEESLRLLPMLVIDDEADQASVNTGNNRAAVDDDLEPEELEALDEELAPSKINGLIRELLSLAPRSTYVGYTATPFANALIDPDGYDREVGETLFPRDFVLQLPRPDGYMGTAEVFGIDGGSGRDVLRFIPEDEAAMLRPRQRELNRFNPEITPSLAHAVEDFILSGAVRLLRGQDCDPNTMLVHTSHRTEVQGLIAGFLGEHVVAVKSEWEYGTGEGGIRSRLRRRWEDDFSAGIDVELGTADNFEDLSQYLDLVINRLHVLELNSATTEELDYRKGVQLQVIAVGGNRLSRGLTLEGLTVSYFLRASGMGDTLLQMARWFGFRHGFEDLIRIHTTEDLAGWFMELSVVESDLRDELERMIQQDVSPYDQGVRIRSHSSMLLTSRLKMRHGTTIRVGYSGEHPQTIVFPLQDIGALTNNLDATRELIEAGNAVEQDSGILVRGIQLENVVGFINKFVFAEEMRAMDPRHLSTWLERRGQSGDLVDWTVYVDGRAGSPLGSLGLGEFTVGMVKRTKLAGTNSIGILIDPKHEAIDLEGGADQFRRGNSYDAGAMRRARPRNQGLLMIYPISPDSRPDQRPGNRIPLFGQDDEKPECVIGFGLSLPFVEDDTATEYVVGNRWAGDAR
jgi:hypothetical protein